MTKTHGTPIWYELTTSRGNLSAAKDFYERALGWQVGNSVMEEFDYRLAETGGDKVAGLMEMPEALSDMPPMWMIYFGVDDADTFVADATKAGARLHKPLEDIPGTGRFAILADPQGAGFGVLKPIPMEGQQGGAFDQQKVGHGNWNELMTTDPAGALTFYTGLFGWQKSDAMDMGEMGTYQLFRHDGADIGAIMGLGNAPMPTWLPYFGVDGTTNAIQRIKDAGGTVHHGPIEVPGGVLIAIATDPQGAWFAVVGPEKTS